MSTGLPTENHWLVLAWVSSMPSEEQTQQASAGQLTVELQSQTSGCQDVAENIAFLVEALCRQGGFPGKGLQMVCLGLGCGMGSIDVELLSVVKKVNSKVTKTHIILGFR